MKTYIDLSLHKHMVWHHLIPSPPPKKQEKSILKYEWKGADNNILQQLKWHI